MKNHLKGLCIWGIITLFVMYAFVLVTAASVFADTIQSYLALSTIEAAFAVGSFVIGFSFMQIPAGYLLDRFSIRVVTSIGVFLLALGNLSLSFSSTLSLFALSNFTQGIGAAFGFIAAGKLIGQWFSPKTFPVLFGLTQTVSFFSAAAAHYGLESSLKALSWQTVYQRMSIFGFILFLATAFFVKSPSHIKAKKNISLMKSLGSAFGNGKIWVCSLAAATSLGVLFAYASFWYVNVQDHFDVSAQHSLIISGMIFMGMGIGTPFLGWLSNKMHSRKLILHTSVVLGCLFLLAGIYFPLFNGCSYAHIQSISFFLGFFLSGSMLYYTCVSELAQESTRAISLGMTNSFVFAFNTLLLFLPNLLITQKSASHFTYLWVLPACVLASIFLSYFVKETFPKS